MKKTTKSAESGFPGEVPMSFIGAYFAKRTQFYSFFAQKREFGKKTNPKRTQTKPNLGNL
jgi:hypothetical protein